MDRKRIVIILIIIVLIISIAGLIFFGIGNSAEEGASNSGDRQDSKGEYNSKDNNIVQVKIGISSSTMLTDSGELYAVGRNVSYGDFGNVETKDKKLPKATLIASNVKKFYSSSYIDNNGDLYVCGVNPIQGGTYKSYTKIGSNIKEATSCFLGLMAVSNDGYLYAWGKERYSGLDKKYDTLTKVEGISNVKQVNLTLQFVCYLTESGELYAKEVGAPASSFEKIIDNVQEMKGMAIKTNDNKCYKLEWDYKTQKLKMNLIENANGIITLADGTTYATNDGNIVSDNIKNNYPDDVKEMLYYYHGRRNGL